MPHPHPVEPWQFLGAFDLGGGWTASAAVCRRIGRTSSTFRRLVALCLRNGWVERSPLQGGGQETTYHLYRITDEGIHHRVRGQNQARRGAAEGRPERLR